jgi:hypothetical protein
MVDRSPIDKLHSLANKVTLNVVSDFPGLPCAGASCDAATVVEGDKSYKRTTLTIKAEFNIPMWEFKNEMA